MNDFLNDADSPLTDEQKSRLSETLNLLDTKQLHWLGAKLAAPQEAVPASTGGKKLTILYGSQTGNAEGLAEATAESARGKGFEATAVCMSDYNVSKLKKEQNVFVVCSTHGEGEPPDTAIEFHEFVHGKRAPKMAGINFSVLALGDTSYEFYCKTGADFDEQFEKLGGTRVAERVDCDLDYDDPAAAWIEDALKKLETAVGGSGGTAVVTTPAAASTSQYNKKNPFPAEVLESILLNGRGSDKETLHIEISLEDSGLVYEPGDAIGVYPTNAPHIVNETIELLSLAPDSQVQIGDDSASLLEALSHRLEITILTKPLIAKYAQASGATVDLLSDDKKELLKEYIEGRDIRDLIKDYPPKELSAQALADCLRKLPARLYSIASSLEAHPDEVHLTVGVVRYQLEDGEERGGLCSTYLSDRLDEDAKVPVYVDKNKNFKLPGDGDTPMIMIGPGTGIAPFRAFIEEREAAGSQGANWLLFGDQHFDTDFLYQAEWLKYHKNGLLDQIDVAFSRDQDEKIYVQHRMLEKSQTFYKWLEEGAYVYVCGDESRMAHDVHTALIEIVQKEGGKSEDEAVAYVKQLQKDKRYQRDVY